MSRLPLAVTLALLATACGAPADQCADAEPIGQGDADGDGYVDEDLGGSDCSDTNPEVHPAAAEVCDELDNDCDGDIDEGTSDVDQDGLCDGLDTEECDGVDNDGDGDIDEECGDVDNDGIADGIDLEDCDGIDNDGDGDVDEDFGDADADGTVDCLDAEECDGVDNDGDGVADEGCADTDGDGVPDTLDEETCDGIDNDGNGQTDEGLTDSDADGSCDDVDLCTGDDTTGDEDQDGVCDDTDDCLGDDASGDADDDGLCDEVDVCVGDNLTGDVDNDGVCDDQDACWGDDGSDDTDGDGVCDDIDCDDTGDADGDEICDDADLCEGADWTGDGDEDGVCDSDDLCAGDDASGDTDGDGICDDNDLCVGDDASGDSDGDGTCDDNDCNGSTDSDGDGVCDDADQCLGDDSQGDADQDGICDDRDDCIGDDTSNDTDNDGICDDLDPCDGSDNVDADGDDVCDSGDLCDGDDTSGDSDNDGTCDDIDPCTGSDNVDADGDGVCDSGDSCTGFPNDDADGDGLCDTDDPCTGDPNVDDDEDGVCNSDDPCDGFPNDDADGDTICDDADLCPGEDDLEDLDNNDVPDCLEEVCNGKDDDLDGIVDDNLEACGPDCEFTSLPPDDGVVTVDPGCELDAYNDSHDGDLFGVGGTFLGIGSPSTYQPLVANVTDDNTDGVIDDLDVPDVIMIDPAGPGGWSNQGDFDNDGTMDLMEPSGSALLVYSGDGSGLHYSGGTVTYKSESLAIQDDSGMAVFIDDANVPVFVVMVFSESNGAAYVAALEPDPNNAGQVMVRWVSPAIAATYDTGHQPTVGQDRDGNVLIGVAGQIIDGATGAVLQSKASVSRIWGVFADVDGDGDDEYLTGNELIDVVDGVSKPWGKLNHHPLVVDMSTTSTPDLWIVSADGFFVDAHDDLGSLLWSLEMPSESAVGALAAGDVTGDGIPEIIASTNRGTYIVDPLASAGNEILETLTGGVNPTLFDHDGDGDYAVISGEQIWDEENNVVLDTLPTRTIHGLATDTDGDGDGEILLLQQNPSGNRFGYGVVVYEPAIDSFEASPLWHQFDVNQDNANVDGTLTGTGSEPWLVENTYRASPGVLRTAAPADAVDLQIISETCTDCVDEIVTIGFTVQNFGTADTPPNTLIPVSLYSNDGQGGLTYLQTVSVGPTESGTHQQPVFMWAWDYEVGAGGLTVVVDDPGTSVGIIDECDETNNSATVFPIELCQ